MSGARPPATPAVAPGELRHRLERLAGELTIGGTLRSPAWADAFGSVARHVFVPRYLHDDQPGAVPPRWRTVDGDDLAHRDEWLDAVYSDRTLITDLKPVPAADGRGSHPIVTSSSTLPGLVIRMLEDLDVHDGQHVLEIGTGTGYSTALLCARLGDEHVTSVDIDPVLVEAARHRLAAHGYHPALLAADGAHGAPAATRYDRIIATCAVDRIHPAWVAQTRPGGMILANLRGNLMRGAQVRLTVTDQHTACGPFLPGYGSFMALRHDPRTPFDYSVPVHKDPAPPTEGTTDLEPGKLATDQALVFVAQLAIPDAITCPVTAPDGADGTELAAADGSWTHVAHEPDRSGRYRTLQAGPRRLWDILETRHRQWTELGRPGWDRFGLTVTSGRHRIWFGKPRSDLPPGLQPVHWLR